MTDLVAEAMARRGRLLDELSRLDQFLETARLLEGGSPSAHDPSEALTTGQPTPAELVDATAKLLRDGGRPLGRGELFRRMRDAGLRISGVDPVKNLGTILWRSGRFDNTGRMYWFKDEDRPSST